ncbi:MAG: ABC transporter ATP-binding protein [Halanaerobiales bacterium]
MSKWVLEGVTKIFDKTIAINNISLEIEENRIYGLLGRNGAGKTTLLKLLANQIQPTEGVIRKGNEELNNSDILTQEVCLARETINMLSIRSSSVKEILDIASRVYPYWDDEYCEELINRFSLDIRQKHIRLSRGMQTMVGIIIGLASRAPLTLFDEPYVGLDPVARETFYESLLVDYEENKRTIIISSHLMSELENLFERVLIIDKGSLLLNEEMETIREKARVISGDRERVEDLLKDKKVIYRQYIGRLANYTVFDNFTEDELSDFKRLNINYSPINLQKLFVNLSRGGNFNGKE